MPPGSDPALPEVLPVTLSAPADTDVVPVYVFVPDRVSVPVPVLVKAGLPPPDA
jgi:hypothetical protein